MIDRDKVSDKEITSEIMIKKTIWGI